MHKFISIPELRYSDRLKCITKIDLIPISTDYNLNYKWNINKSEVFFWNTRYDSLQLDFNIVKFFDGLSIEFTLTKDGQFLDLLNFDTLKDSLFSRAQIYFTKDSIIASQKKLGFNHEIDFQLFDYYFKSTIDKKVFMDLHFPEILLFFEVNNKTFTPYKSNMELVKTTFRKFELYEIEMTKNTMLVFDNNFKSEIEIQFELTNIGCDRIHKQLIKRIQNKNTIGINKIQNFECQRSRITQNYKYDKRLKLIESIYEKKTLTINDEPYYFWTELKMR